MQIPDPHLRAVLDPLTVDWRSRPPQRDAAVLAPLFSRAGQDWVLFTKRRDDLKTHAGEISFPGGAREGDEDALACALRETHEEIGLAATGVDVLGRLPERPSIGGYFVNVFVGRIAPPDRLTIDPTEVASLLSIPVAELRREDRWEWRDVPAPRLRARVPFFEFEGEVLWGLTAIFTRDLLGRLD